MERTFPFGLSKKSNCVWLAMYGSSRFAPTKLGCVQDTKLSRKTLVMVLNIYGVSLT
jgi:hypothetical protein